MGKSRNALSDNPNWKGGVSRGFCHQRRRQSALRKYGYTCAKCGTKKKRLYIHHVDANPRNNEERNLLPVCRPCHNRIHGLAEYIRGRSPLGKRRLLDRKCPICKELFRPRHAKTVFCSKECRNTGHSRSMQRLPKIHCTMCGKIFLPRSRASRFCSQACFGLSCRSPRTPTG